MIMNENEGFGNSHLWHITLPASVKNTEEKHEDIKTIGIPTVRPWRYRRNEMFREH
jgi:hypothetical protein